MIKYQELNIIRGETPSINIIIPEELSLASLTDIRVSLTQDISSSNIQKTLKEGSVSLDDHIVVVEFSQEETLGLFSSYKAYIQVNLLFEGNKRLPSKLGVVNVLPNNYEEVMIDE